MTKTEPSAVTLCNFLSRYSATLLGAGATCIRLTKNAERIAEAYGRRIQITIMPRYVQVALHGGDDTAVTVSTEPVPEAPISFNINARLSILSWQVHDNGLAFDEMVNRFNAAVRPDCQNSPTVMMLASIANASFCRLFGGDATAMLIVFIATCAGYHLKQELLKHRVDTRITFIICAFLSSVIASADSLFALGTAPEVALGTSVLYLVPGIPFLNSFSDMLYRHYICSLCRFADAVILTCCLSAGLCAGMFLMGTGMF